MGRNIKKSIVFIWLWRMMTAMTIATITTVTITATIDIG